MSWSIKEASTRNLQIQLEFLDANHISKDFDEVCKILLDFSNFDIDLIDFTVAIPSQHINKEEESSDEGIQISSEAVT